MSAILRHASVEIKLARPNGAKGRIVTDWLSPPDADGIVIAAEEFDPEMALLLRFYCTPASSGRRAQPATRGRQAQRAHGMDPASEGSRSVQRAFAGGSGAMGLSSTSISRAHRRVFRFHQGGHLKHLARAGEARLSRPPLARPVGRKDGARRRTGFAWVNFHTMRHTWATWMRRKAGTDVLGLVATGNWRDKAPPRDTLMPWHATNGAGSICCRASGKIRGVRSA